MSHFELQPITITPEQIIAAAQKIADGYDEAWQRTEAQWLEAVENYLRCKLNDILTDVDWHAGKDRDFMDDAMCDYPNCQAKPAPHSIACAEHSGWGLPDEARELTLPETPYWAKERADLDTAIVQRPDQAQVEADGDILYCL